MLKLQIVPAEGEPFEHVFEGDSLVIGRSSRCDLAVADRCLSRQHVRIFKSDDDWMVEDMGSRNGTRLNGVMISKPTKVRPGDMIDASMSRMTVGGSPAAPSPPSYASTMEDGRTLFRSASDIIAESERDFARPTEAEHEVLLHAAEQLRVLYDVHHALDASTTADELLDGVLDRVFVHLKPQHGAIFLKDGGRLVRATSRSLTAATDAFPESSSLASEVIDKGLAAVVHDTSTDVRFVGAESLLDAGVRTLVAAPLLTPEGAIGMIVLSSSLANRKFAEPDMELLTVVASATGLRLRNLALAEEAAERKRFEQEVTLARRIQVALLPAEMPQVPGLEVYGGNTPSRGVSGDYYQVIDRPDTREIAVVIADVSGKGIAASLLTGYVDALVNAFLGENMEPAEIFNRVSPQMNAKTPVESFATAFLGIYSLESGALRFASAGHDPSILVRADGEVELLNPTGMPLGLMPDATYTASEAQLWPGDSLILYTDGITEASKPNDEMFERERLVATCREHRAEPPAALAHLINATVDAFVEGEPYHDDRTMVILRRVEPD
jgi:sigma-B regulation protein RsbU (phosphoserine phosphatase)